MEATAHIAALVIQQMYCKLEGGTPCNTITKASEKLGSLKDWASKDDGWERILSSLSLYELAKRFWQQEDYDRALVAVEQSIALKLFPYADAALLERWQRSLVSGGQQFVRQKSELADALMLKADCLLELALADGKVQLLDQAMESLELAATLLHGNLEQGPAMDVVANLKTVATQVAAASVELLPKLRISQLRDLMDEYGLPCQACVEKQDLLASLLEGLRLPVALSESTGRLEPLANPLPMDATPLPGGRCEQSMAQLLSQLLRLVHIRFLEDLKVPCTKHNKDSQGPCLSYLPLWVARATCDEQAGQPPDRCRSCDASDTGTCGACSSCAAAASGTCGSGPGRPGAPAGAGRADSCGGGGSSSSSSSCGTTTGGPDANGRLGTYLVGMGTLIEKMLRSDYSDVQGMLRKLDHITGGQATLVEVCTTKNGRTTCAGGHLESEEGGPPGGSSARQSGEAVGSCGPDPAALNMVYLEHLLQEGGVGVDKAARQGAGGGSSGGGAGGGRGSGQGSCSAAGSRQCGGQEGQQAPKATCSGACPAAPAPSAREVADRQLREQLAKAASTTASSAGGASLDRDSPLIPVVLCVCILGGLGLCVGVKHKRRLQRFLVSQGLRGGRDGRSAASAPGTGAITAKQVAAALRDALGSADLAKLEAAVKLADEQEFDQPILQKARVALQQRKRKERERAAAERASRREAERRCKSKARRRVSQTTDGGSNDGSDLVTLQDGERAAGSRSWLDALRLSRLISLIKSCFRPHQTSGDDSTSGGAQYWHGGSGSPGSQSDASAHPSDLQPFSDRRNGLPARNRINRSDSSSGDSGHRAAQEDLQLAAVEDSAYMMMYSTTPRSESAGSDSDGWQEQTHSRRRTAKPPTPPVPAVIEVVRKRTTAASKPAAPPTHSKRKGRELNKLRLKPQAPASTALVLTKRLDGHPPKPSSAGSSWLGWLGSHPTPSATTPPLPPVSTSASNSRACRASRAVAQPPPATPINRWSNPLPHTGASSTSSTSSSAASLPPAQRPKQQTPSRKKLDPNAPPYHPTCQQTPPRAPPTPPPAPSPTVALPDTPPRSATKKPYKPSSQQLPSPLHRTPSYPQCPSPTGLSQYGIVASPDPHNPYLPYSHLPADPYNFATFDASPHLSTLTTPSPAPDLEHSGTSSFFPSPLVSTLPTPSPNPTHPTPTSSSYSYFATPPLASHAPRPSEPSLPPSLYSLFTTQPTPIDNLTPQPASDPPAQPPQSSFYSMFSGGSLWDPELSSMNPLDDGAWHEAPKRLSEWRSAEPEADGTDHGHTPFVSPPGNGEEVLGSSCDLPDATWVLKVVD